jgi:L-ribulose-5-phosphate 3-epimerase
MPSRIGVCSWSLQPDSPESLVARLQEAGLDAVQLALDPIRRGDWPEIRTLQRLASGGIRVLSGMMGFKGEDYTTPQTIRQTGGVRPDSTWPENLRAAAQNAALADRLGLRLVTFHAGFIPHDRADPVRPIMIERLRAVIDLFDARGIRVGFETGQETADTLLDALDELDRPHVGVNFDPANMLLYGMGDPIDALRRLAPRVVQVHIKDALAPERAGQWGREVPAGTGQVRWGEFFQVLRRACVECDLLIEREAGGSRLDDVRAAKALAERHGA